MPRVITPLPSPIRGLDDRTDVNVTDRGEGLKVATGLADDDETAATGLITFADVPAEDDTITVNGVVFTFKATPVAGTDIDIKLSAAAQATEVASVLNASTDDAVEVATYAVVDDAEDNKVSVTHDTEGSAGNDFTLEADGADITVSAAHLTGGKESSYQRVVKTFMRG